MNSVCVLTCQVFAQTVTFIFHTLSTHEVAYYTTGVYFNMGTWEPFTVLSSMVMTVSFVSLVELLPLLSNVNMYNNLRI